MIHRAKKLPTRTRITVAWLGGLMLLLAPVLSAAEFELSAVDRALPVFEMAGLNDDVWDNKALSGKPYIVNFWATWCAPCVHELPAMNRAAEKLIDEGIGMLAINMGENPAAIASFMQRVPIEFPVALGTQATFSDWKILGLPTTYIVSTEGNIIASAVGPREWDDPEFIAYMLTLK